MKRAVLVLSLLGAVALPNVALPGIASAQNVIVLGIRSLEGDDEFARNLTGALSHAASQVEGWSISDREVTLSQMALVHGCDDPNPTCLRSIAEGLSVSHVIYGDISRSSSGGDYEFSLSLHHYNNETGHIDPPIAATVSRLRTDIDDLREPARRWILRLSGAPQMGALVVRVNVPGAAVALDGEPVGVVDSDGLLRLPEVSAGSHRVQITADEHATFSSTVSVTAFGEASLEAELERRTGGGGGGVPLELVVGSALMVVAAGAAAMWIYGGVTVADFNGSGLSPDRIPGDPSVTATWGDVRNNYPTGEQACDMRSSDPERGYCRDASTAEILEFVGLGVTIAAGALGLYFLIAGLSGDDDSGEAATLEFVPSVGPQHGYLGARLRF